MTLWIPETLEIGDDLRGLDERLEAAPNRPAVFLVHPREGTPYLGRTALLRRRLQRLLKERAQPSRWLNLRSVAARVEYRLTASWLETSLVFYELARRHFPDSYRKLMKLRMPAYVKVILSNRFPRSQVTSRISGARAVYYGPFRSRVSAEQFESQFLDLFQMRRCQEDLDPSPEHPGCIYGEMGMCLRPCQRRVGPEEYRSEVDRAVEFLATGGRSLLDSATRARDQLSEELQFEEAFREHKRVEKIQHVIKLRDEPASEIGRLHGVAVTPSVAAGSVELWFVVKGCWQTPQRFSYEPAGGKTVSMDHRLREMAASIEPRKVSLSDLQDHLALLARWHNSTWREGEWIPFERLDAIPIRKLVHAISRLAKGER